MYTCPNIGIVQKRQIFNAYSKDEFAQYYTRGVYDRLVQYLHSRNVGVFGLMPRLDFTSFAITDQSQRSEAKFKPTFEQLESCNGLILQGDDSIHSYEEAVALYAYLRDVPLLGLGSACSIMHGTIILAKGIEPRGSVDEESSGSGSGSGSSAILQALNTAVAGSGHDIKSFGGTSKKFYYGICPRRHARSLPNSEAVLCEVLRIFLSTLL